MQLTSAWAQGAVTVWGFDDIDRQMNLVGSNLMTVWGTAWESS